MRVLNKYRLELHWDTAEYPEDDIAVFKGAYFSGPVLTDAAKINDNDQLIIDMTLQHSIHIPEYYQATLRWGKVGYQGDKVFLKEATLQGKYVNSVETLGATDWILIDCKEHEEAKHPFHLVYWAEVCKKNKEKKF